VLTTLFWLWLLLALEPLASSTGSGGAPSAGAAGGAPAAGPPEGARAGARQTTELVLGPRVGRPIEREPEITARAPSLRRAIEKDRDLRFGEATVLYQTATVELASALRLASTPLLERALYKVERERQRSAALAALADTPRSAGGSPGSRQIAAAPTPAHDRARLYRAKLMTVRAATGVVAPGLLAETLRALDEALRRSSAQAPGGDPEVRLLLCATRAASGDRPRARLELAHVSDTDRLDPARAAAAAACAAALGDLDRALGDLAVAVSRQGSSGRLDFGPNRDLHSSNDWDPLRGDPRFDALF
jgi:hypothetical protein